MGKEERLYPAQAGVIMKFAAKEGKRDDASFERHISNPALDGGHNKVIDMVDMTRDMAKYKIYARYSN